MKTKKPSAAQLLRSFDAVTREQSDAVFKRAEVMWELRYEGRGRHGKDYNYVTLGYPTWKACLTALADRAGTCAKILERELKVFVIFTKVFKMPQAREIGYSKLREISSRWDTFITFCEGEGECIDPRVVRNVQDWLKFCKQSSYRIVANADMEIPKKTLRNPASISVPKKQSKAIALFSASSAVTEAEGASMRKAVQEARTALNLPDLSEAEALATYVAGMLRLMATNKSLAAKAHEAMREAQQTLKAA